MTNTPSTQYFTNFEQGAEVLMQKLGYQFCDVQLLRRALTHRSFDPKNEL